MRCKKLISYLNAYADGELPESLCRIVDDHLASCEVCQGRLEDLRKIDALFQSALPVPPVPDGFVARIMAEARRRQPSRAFGRHLFPAWNPFGWIAGFSVPMRLASFATVLLALVAGLSLDGGYLIGQEAPIGAEKNLYGLEWFEPTPPGSISSIYIAMNTRTYEKGNGQ